MRTYDEDDEEAVTATSCMKKKKLPASGSPTAVGWFGFLSQSVGWLNPE